MRRFAGFIKIVLICAASAATLSHAGTHPLPAAPPSAQEAMNFTVEGKITQHSGNKLTINSEGNIIFRVVYNEKTSFIRKDGGAGSSKDLSVGIRIHVDGDLTESGEIIARKITLQSEAGAKSR